MGYEAKLYMRECSFNVYLIIMPCCWIYGFAELIKTGFEGFYVRKLPEKCLAF